MVMTRRDNNVIIGSLWGKKPKQTSQWNGNKRDGFAVTMANVNAGKQERTKKKVCCIRKVQNQKTSLSLKPIGK